IDGEIRKGALADSDAGVVGSGGRCAGVLGQLLSSQATEEAGPALTFDCTAVELGAARVAALKLCGVGRKRRVDGPRVGYRGVGDRPVAGSNSRVIPAAQSE